MRENIQHLILPEQGLQTHDVLDLGVEQVDLQLFKVLLPMQCMNDFQKALTRDQ